MNKKIKTTEVSVDIERAPSNFYIMNAMGNFVFFHTKDRDEAQRASDALYGKGFYQIRTTDLSAKSKSKRQLLADIDEANKQENET